MTTDPEDAIREVIIASYEMFGDHSIDQEMERLYRERARELRTISERTNP